MRDQAGTHVRVRAACGSVLAAVLAISVGAVVTGPGDGPRVVVRAAAAPTPLDRVRRVLDRQAAALARGDPRGWLAAVDPAQPGLRRRYQDLYRTLRALRVTTVEYRVAASAPLPFATVELTYCFAEERCGGVAQALTFRPAGSGSVISGLASTSPQPTPWERGELVFAQGRRVTVGAPRALAGRLAEVVAAADEAAAIDDRFAAYMRNPQPRYRLFLATDRLWRDWYHGKGADWAAGYMRPLGAAGADAVINMSRIHGRATLRSVIRHELGHVATIGGVAPAPDDMWLVEGVAEYIAAGTPAGAGSTRPSIVLRPLRDGARRTEVTSFYALARSAVACLAAEFGEPRAMEFVRLRLRSGTTLDAAARSVLGRPFDEVDGECVRWISRHGA